MTEGGSNARGDRVAAKLSLLRLKLDQLGYNEPLGADSLALVDRLFSDHMHTVESVEQLQTRLDESERRAQEKVKCCVRSRTLYRAMPSSSGPVAFAFA